eukprot:TRINITY_DN23646_c0_g1_i2.p1 TRINITY_DN23646_c0_g1~~TRINITY_DN23646_c0_g1_i2.p1  ORF type:complete len:152 (-),score=19.20 TRINITY_DN23646_c0_g1_i2:11-466(-)
MCVQLSAWSSLGAPTFNALIQIVGNPQQIPDFWEKWQRKNGRGNQKIWGFKMEVKTYVMVSRRSRRKIMNEDHLRIFLWMINNGLDKPSARDASEVFIGLERDGWRTYDFEAICWGRLTNKDCNHSEEQEDSQHITSGRAQRHASNPEDFK